jgi:hypothetical protein
MLDEGRKSKAKQKALMKNMKMQAVSSKSQEKKGDQVSLRSN